MLTRVYRMDVNLQKKEKKYKILWAFIDEYGHTIIQVYSEKYPKYIKEFLKEKNDKTNCIIRRTSVKKNFN